ncbi:MAG: alpha/beta hydrolase, partial [Chloroflexi bacterium]|nr:alpha/beta hydrolase [Chloroflexota bacterium]
GGAIDDDVRQLQADYRQTEMGQMPLGKKSVSPQLKERAAALEFLYRGINKLNPPRPKDFLAPVPGHRGSSAQRLAESGMKIMFLVGDHDAVTPPEIIEGCHRAVPGSKFVVIPNSGHSTYFEQPEAFNATVLEFLQETVQRFKTGNGAGQFDAS